MDKVIVTDGQELTIRRQADEVVRRVLKGKVPFDFASPRLQAIVVGVESVEKRQQKKRDLAEERRAWFENWYRRLGFTIFTVTVPEPAVSNREFARREKLGQALFYRPATKDLSYVAFMTIVGQGDHWTVKVEDERAKIGWWESMDTGYWFWAEVVEDCPRLKTPWNDLTKAIKLLSLEEYVIVCHAHKAEHGERLDIRTRSWLRTRFGQSALSVYERDGRVNVSRQDDPEDLLVPYGDVGGRAVEVVKA